MRESPEARKVEVLLRMGRAEEAARLAEQLPARDHAGPGFLRLRGRAQRAVGRHFDAEQSFREALSLAPGDGGLLADVATTLVGQKRHREALSFARDAVAASPSVAAYHALLGITAEALLLDEEAERALGTARALSPGDPEAHVVYGFAALRLGKIDAALASFRDALRVDPTRAQAHRGLARTLAEAGDLAAARASWAEALALDPDLDDPAIHRKLNPPRQPPRWIAAILAIPPWAGMLIAALGFGVALSDPWAGVPLFVMAALGPVIRIGWEDP